MTATPTKTTAPARPRRGEGQWALGHLEPLNPNERSKKDGPPLEVRARIENIYAKGGFASIDPGDLRGRFRWYGLYTQRKPGIDAGSMSTLEPHELDDEYFMLRVRIDGGQLTVAQLRVIAEVSQRYARGTADLTDRQNVQLHWVRIEDVPAIWELLEGVGLSTTEACGDCPRVVLGSPAAGVAAAEVLDPTPMIDEITRRFIGDPSLANLPRKWKTSISWLPDTPYQTNDIAFIGSVHPEYGPGFDVWVGGGLSTNPMIAQRLGAWVPLQEVPDVWLAALKVFRDYGYRRLRHRARVKFLVNDWGAARYREVMEKEYLGRPLIDGPAPQLPDRPIDHIGVHEQVDGRHYVGVAPVAGRVSGDILAAVADVAAAHGSDRIRITPQQKLMVLDIVGDKVDSLVAGLSALGLQAGPSSWRRHTMACTGIEYCKLAIVETKVRAADLVTALERDLADLDVDITVSLSGCPNACARTQVADIGLKGQLVPDADGVMVEGFQIHLGGGLALAQGQESGFGRKLRGLKTTADALPAYVQRIARRYAAQRGADESFAVWALRAAEDDLR